MAMPFIPVNLGLFCDGTDGLPVISIIVVVAVDTAGIEVNGPRKVRKGSPKG